MPPLQNNVNGWSVGDAYMRPAGAAMNGGFVGRGPAPTGNVAGRHICRPYGMA